MQTKYVDIAVVEGQESYLGPGRHARVSDLLDLACVTGACLAACSIGTLVDKVVRPLPKQWKGSKPKRAHQAQLCRELGWTFENRADYVVPTPPYIFDEIPYHIKSDWKHIMDAIGLAMWGLKQL